MTDEQLQKLTEALPHIVAQLIENARVKALVTWFLWYWMLLRTCSPVERDDLEQLRHYYIKPTIEKVLKTTWTPEFSQLYEYVEAFEYEMTAKLGPQYLQGVSSIEGVRGRTRRYLSKRKNSWVGNWTREKEMGQVLANSVMPYYESEDDIEQGATEPAGVWAEHAPEYGESYHGLNPPDPYRLSPEDALIEAEYQEGLGNSIDKVGGSSRKWAVAYKTILISFLDGTVASNSEMAQKLGISYQKVSNLKRQAIQLLRNEIAGWDKSGVIQAQQAVYDFQEDMEWKAKKTNSEDRREQYKDPYEKVYPPRTIRVLRVRKGTFIESVQDKDTNPVKFKRRKTAGKAA